MRRTIAMLLAVMMLFALAATQAFAADAEVPSGVEDGVLTIAMERRPHCKCPRLLCQRL